MKKLLKGFDQPEAITRTKKGEYEDVALVADFFLFADRLPVLCAFYVLAPGIVSLFPTSGET